LVSAVIPVLEQLEDRRLFSTSTIQTLPFSLDFGSDRGELVDKDGQGTGFTRVQANKLGNEYQPALIDLDTAAGVLKITTTGNSTAGSNSLSDNTQVNALETQFDGTSSGFMITARLKGPLTFINDNYEQGGIYFGPDQDNFVKLVALKGNNGQVLQFKDEQNGTTTALPNAAQNYNIGSFANISTLDVRLVGDAATGKVSAYYAINGSNFVKVPYDLTLSGTMKAKFFTSAARAGLLQSHKNDVGPITVTYDSFDIKAGTPVTGHPFVTATRPGDGDSGVSRDAFVAADVSLPTPGAGVDAATLSTATVLLYRTSDHMMVPGVVNTTGGGDAIVYQPTDYLAANTSYTFEVTSGVKDTAGSTFLPYVATFTTGNTGGPSTSNIQFDKVALTTTNGSSYTSVTIGPDKKLYATTIDGHIIRWNLNADGTLGTSQIIDTIRNKEGGDRAIIGLTFDPKSTASNLIAYVSSNAPSLENAPDWSGKITKLTGANLSTATDLITNLPRSIRDHMTNQMVFGPDGALYISQASTSAMGAPDNAWGLRPEHLLNAAILRLDLTKLGSSPLNVQTEGVSNPYNPFAAGAPLTIYATGVRNSYDLIWTSTGHLYASTNGSAANGATPASPDGTVKGISPVTQTEDDFFYDIKQGKYYGHPNPTRGEYVQDGGNPTTGVDNILANGNYTEEFTQYPVGTKPDSDYEGAIWDYGKNYSPNGMIEYKGNAFGGALDGKILVVRYSGGDDIIVLSPNADGSKITSAQTGIAGFTQFVDPLDITEDTNTGFLYVAEYGGQRITLLKPIQAGANIDVSKKSFYFNDIQTASSGGSGSSPTQKLTITNNGTAALLLDSNAFQNTGTNAAQFKVSGLPSLPYSLAPGQSLDVQLSYTANAVGIQTATLNINSNAGNAAQMQIALRGIGTTGNGGTNEPSLQRILDLYQIPVTVGDNNSADTTFPMPPTTPNDEVVMPRLLKAGNGSVSVELLGVFANNDVAGPSLGYYEPGTPEFKTVLFGTKQSEAQSVSATPQGNTTFDPGSSMFSLVGIFPKFTNREVYSEDSLNTWESNSANRRKVRFYPLKNSDGTVVPNAYVFAFEEYNVTYDQNDIVGIIRNVKAAPSGAEIGLQNMDGGPYADRLVFNRIENLDPTVPNVVHDQATLRIKNTGDNNLSITNMVLSSGFTFVSGGGAATIAPGATKDVVVKFTASGVDITNGTLTISSNDSDEPNKVVQLSGWWQSYSENNTSGVSQEPHLEELMKVFGYSSVVGTPAQLNTGGLISKVGEEVLSPYWWRADSNAPVTVRMLAAFHQQKTTTASNIKWYYKGASGTKTNLFTHNYTEGQSLYPHLSGSTTQYAQATFSPTSTVNPFGLYVDGKFTDDSLNPLDNNTPNTGHSFRFYIAKDRDGKVIPNTYIMAMDYTGVSYSNYDYQDNIYLISNVKPVNPPSAPVGMNSSASGSGIKVSWTANTEGNVAGYRIYRSDSASGTFALLNTELVTTNNYTDILAPVGQTSYYRVTAVDVHGNESAYNTTSATRTSDTAAPAQPTGLIANGLTTGISLNWDDNTETDLAGYDVYRSTSSGGTYTKLNTSKLTSSDYVDTGATAGTTYYYRVYAIDTSNNQSAYASASATRPASGTVPASASNLAITSSSTSGVSLTWADNSSNEVSFRIERKIGSGGTYAPLTTLGANATSYTDTSVSAGNTYYYRVVASGTGGDASPSNEVSATISSQAGAYTSADIGNPAVSGATSTINDGTDYDVTGGGIDIWNSSDQFQFAYQQLAGDFDMKVQVNSLVGQDSGIMAGLMARESLAANAKNAYIKLRPAGFRFTYRSSTGGTSSAAGSGAATAPNSWLRLVRSGTTFTGYGSTDGSNWTLIGSTTITMGSTLYFGMAVSGHSTTTNAVAQFRNLSSTSQTVAPTAPSNLVATANTSDIGLTWQDNSNNEDGFIIERKTGNGSYGTVFTTAANATSWTDTNVVAGTTYTYRVTAKSATLGNSSPSNESSATIQSQQQDNFNSSNIGDATGGSTTVVTANKDYDVTANGSNIYYTVDGMRFTYQQLTGDFDAKVRIADVTTNNSDPLAGLMARASLGSNSINAIMRTYGSSPNQYKFGYRSTTGGNTTSVGGGTNSYPNSWVRLVRSGDTFTGYYSSNGTSWTLLGSTTINMGSTVYVGMAVASRASTFETVQFRDLSITQSGTSTAPAAPSNLSAIGAENKVNLNWTDNSNDETGFIIERKTGSGGTYAPIFTTGANVTSYTDTNVTAGTQYFYRVRATNSGGDSSPSSEDSATPTAPVQDTMTSSNIGDATGGSTTVVTAGKDYDITGSGSNIFYNVDGTRFVYTQLTGDFDVQVRIASVTTNDSDPLVGLMARASLSDNSINAITRTYGSSPNVYKFGYRTTTGGSTSSIGAGSNSYPNSWVRLVRSGDTFTGYYSSNGTSWTNIGSVSLNVGSTMYVGMAVASRASTTETAQFRDLKITQTSTVTAPAAPSNLSAIGAENKVNMSWTDNSSDETGFIIERKTGSDGTFAPIFTTAANVTTYVDTDVVAGTTYYYRVSATNSGGNSAPTAENSAVPTAPVETLSFTSTKIGSQSATGTLTTVTAGSDYDLSGGGNDVWSTSDQLQFAYTQLTGDFDIKVRVADATTANGNPLVGLMARDSLSTNSANAFMRTYGQDGGADKFAYRSTTGGTTSSISGSDANNYPNTWLRLVRTGDTFTGYSSSDGVTWNVVGSTTINMGSTVYVGMAVASRSSGLEAAEFRDLSIA
jgi:fibronectin type 3 domain-containing protein